MKKIALSLLLFSSYLNAGYTNTISLKSCIDMAMNTHPDINIAKQNIKFNQLNENNIIGDYLPQVSVNLEYNPTKTIVLPVNGQFNTIETDGYSANLNLSQKIWDYGRTFDSLKINQNNINIAKYSLKDTKIGLALRTKLKYEEMYFYKKAVEVLKNDVEVKTELYKQAQAQVKEGVKSQIEEKRFLSALYNSKDTLMNTQLDYEKSKESLSILINSKLGYDIVLEDSEIDNHYLIYVDKRYDLHNAPGSKILLEDIKRNSHNIKYIQKQHYGSINLKANLSYQNTINEYDTSYVGIVLDLPLYNGGKISNQVQQARINKLKSDYKLSSKLKLLKDDLNNSVKDARKFHQTIASKKLQITNAEETLDIVTTRWKVGMATYIEVLDSNSILLNSKLNLLQNKLGLKQTLHRLEYLNGEIR